MKLMSLMLPINPIHESSRGNMSPGFDGRWWASGQRHGLRLQPVHYFGDGAFELRVFAFNNRPGVVFDFDVWVYSVAFDHPFAFGVDESEFRHEHRAAVNQRSSVGNADHAAP